MKANLDDFEILYESTIALHSKNKSTKVIIVEHIHQKCIEIVAYNALISLDTARLYINAVLLVEKINCMPDFAIKMSSTIEAREASSQHFDFPAFRKDLVKSFAVKYILARLDTPKDMARGSFNILLNPIEDDLKDKHGRLDVVRNMPHNLKIYEFDHIRRDSTVHHAEIKGHDHKNDNVRLPTLGKSTFGADGNHSVLRDHRHSIDAHVTADHKHDSNGSAFNDHKHESNGHRNSLDSSTMQHHSVHHSAAATAAQDKHHLSPLVVPSGSAPPRALLKKQGSMDDSFIMENTNGMKKFSPRLIANLEAKRSPDDPKTPSSAGLASPSSVSGIAGSESNTPTPLGGGSGRDDSNGREDNKSSTRRVLKRQSSIQELIEGKNINNLPPLSNRRASLSKQAPGSHNNLFHGNKLAAEDLSGSDSDGSDNEEGGSSRRSHKKTPTNANGKELLIREHSDHIPGLKLVMPFSNSNNNNNMLPSIATSSDENVTSPTANALLDAPAKKGEKKSVPGAIKNFKRQFDVVAQITENLNLKLSALDPNTPTYARQTLTSLIQISEEKTYDQRRRSSVGTEMPSRRILQPLNNNVGGGVNHSEESAARISSLPSVLHK